MKRNKKFVFCSAKVEEKKFIKSLSFFFTYLQKSTLACNTELFEHICMNQSMNEEKKEEKKSQKEESAIETNHSIVRGAARSRLVLFVEVKRSRIITFYVL